MQRVNLQGDFIDRFGGDAGVIDRFCNIGSKRRRKKMKETYRKINGFFFPFYF